MAYDLLTGFGANPDNLNTMSLFHIEAGSDGMYGDWEVDPLDSVHQIATTNQYDVHVTGYGPAMLTLQIELETRADFQALRARLLTEGSLQLIAGFTHHDTTAKHIMGRDYARYTNTMLYRISGVRYEIDGVVGCTAVFMREEPLL